MGTLLECLKEARLEKYYPSFRAQGFTRSEALTRLTVHDCSLFGINSAEDRRRLIQLIEIVKQVHSEGPYGGSGNTSRNQTSQQAKKPSPRKRNRSPAITQNAQVSGRALSAASDVRVHERSRINASSHHLSGAGAAILDLISDDDDDSEDMSSSGSGSHSDYEPAVKHSVTASVSRTSPPRIRKTPVEKVKHDAGYNYGVPGGGTPSAAKSKARGGSRLGEEKIKVCVRKRPLSRREIKSGEEDMARAVSTTTMTISEPKQAVDLTAYTLQHEFIFDEVFDENCSNEDVYIRAARPLINCLFDGGSATCFAYGQTGAGKTHTMIGDREVPGLYLLASHDIFSIIESRQYGPGIKVWVSFFEIYCGQLFDLLNRRNRLFAREDGSQRVCIAGLTETEAKDETSLMQVLEYGNAVRSKGATGVNPDSSRSHAVLQMEIRDKQDKRLGRISFIDLAGSERASDSTDTDKQTRMEGAEINQSLLALKECIRSIDQESRHKPFRQSKLTHILKDSFIGNSRTCMIANISPAKSSCEHTLNTLRYADRVKELRRTATSASTSRSVNVAMSNILMNIPASAPSLFQPSNILCSSTPMRQSSKQFTNRGPELNLDPSETPLRGPGARRKTSSAATRAKTSSANSSVNTSVASKASVVRHVASQNVTPTVSNIKQNVSSNSESDQTDTDSNNITGPQKPINIGIRDQTANILGLKTVPRNIPNAGTSPNIPVVKSTDTDNDFPTTDFNDEELNDLNRTGGKQNVAASVPAFSAKGAQQTGSADNYSENRLGAQSGTAQISSVSASVPVMRQKMYRDDQNHSKPSPVVPNDSHTEIKQSSTDEIKPQRNNETIQPAVSGKQSETVKSSGTQVSNFQKPKTNAQSEVNSAYFPSQDNKTTGEAQTSTGINKPDISNIQVSVRSETNSDVIGQPLRIPSLAHESIDDDMLFDPPSVDQRPGIQRTLSDKSGGFLSPPSTRTTPRVPQDPSLEPEIPAVLPAKSSDLTIFSQRSPRWFLQNQNNHNTHFNQQNGFRPEPVKIVAKDENSAQSRFVAADKHTLSNNLPNQFQIPSDNSFNKNRNAGIDRQDSFSEQRKAVLAKYTRNNSVSKKEISNNVIERQAPTFVQTSEILEKLDKLSQNNAKTKSGQREEPKEPISADWFLTPADHDTHVAASVSKPKTISDFIGRAGESKGRTSNLSGNNSDADQTDLKEIDNEYLPVQRNVSEHTSFHSDSGIASESTVNKTNSSKTDDKKSLSHQKGYFSDTGARPKQGVNTKTPNRQVPSSHNSRQAFNNSPVFKDIVSGSPTGPRSNSPLSNRSYNSNSPVTNKPGNGVIKTEKLKTGAIFSPIHPQPVTSDGSAKTTTAVSKDIIHPTPVAKAAPLSDTKRRTSEDCGASNGAIDLKSQLISSHEDQLATVTSLCKQEMKLLLGAKAGSKSFDEYMKKISDILSQKLSAIQLLQDQIIAYQLSMQDS